MGGAMSNHTHQSGNTLYMGRMKDGNKKIRWIMIQAANTTAVRTDDRMKKYYAKIVKRHGHSIAITHVANKMIRIMWYMLKNKETYKDGKPESYQRKLKRIQGQIDDDTSSIKQVDDKVVNNTAVAAAVIMDDSEGDFYIDA